MGFFRFNICRITKFGTLLGCGRVWRRRKADRAETEVRQIWHAKPETLNLPTFPLRHFLFFSLARAGRGG